MLNHLSQPRKHQGNHYEDHILPILSEFINTYSSQLHNIEDTIIVILLHDILEDIDRSLSKIISKIFGRRILEIIQDLTKEDYEDFSGETTAVKKKQRDEKYLTQLLNSKYFEVRVVKSIDMIQNLSCSFRYSNDDPFTLVYIKKIIMFKEVLNSSLYLQKKANKQKLNKLIYIENEK
ncbi:MAG: hypothetical protein Q9M76_00105 [Candidatus Dojkabacteria bacterium]|nr:hypothetical protein [Candidatus Dojkabacteria bacterium]